MSIKFEQRQGAPAVPSGNPEWRRRLLVPTLVLTGSLLAVVSSLGAPLIPTLAQADGVSLSTGEWILTITLLSGALATPVMGRLADGPRQKNVILIALGTVVTGCAIAALSESFAVLLVGRALQGVGLGLLPVTMAIARRNLPPDKARRTIATLSVTVAMGIGLGYPVTGLIAQAFDFRAAYWFGAITIGAALTLAALVLPSTSDIAPRPFDALGAGAISVVIVGVTVVLSEGGGWGWTSARSVVILTACLVIGVVWTLYELRLADPLVDLRQVRNRSVLTADAAGFLVSIAMYIFLPILVEFVQIPSSNGYGFGTSIVVSGLVLIPLSVGSFAASRLLVVYERRFGNRSMIPLGSMVFSVAAIFFAFDHSSLWEAFVASGIAGLGVGFTTGAMPGFIVRAVAQSETGSATGFYQVIRSIGLTVGSALSAAVLMAHTHAGHSLPDVQGFRDTLIIAGALCAATAIVSFVLPGKASPAGLTHHGIERPGLDEMMEEEAELAGVGVMLTEEWPAGEGPEGPR